MPDINPRNLNTIVQEEPERGLRIAGLFRDSGGLMSLVIDRKLGALFNIFNHAVLS
jgi:hypothetical protein